jgi:hypothetical protein
MTRTCVTWLLRAPAASNGVDVAFAPGGQETDGGVGRERGAPDGPPRLLDSRNAPRQPANLRRTPKLHSSCLKQAERQHVLQTATGDNAAGARRIGSTVAEHSPEDIKAAPGEGE